MFLISSKVIDKSSFAVSKTKSLYSFITLSKTSRLIFVIGGIMIFGFSA